MLDDFRVLTTPIALFRHKTYYAFAPLTYANWLVTKCSFIMYANFIVYALVCGFCMGVHVSVYESRTPSRGCRLWVPPC